MLTMVKGRIAFFLGFLLLVSIAGLPAKAQTTSATISGTVTDSSGAAVPETSVRATNVATGVTQATTTSAEGRYRLPQLGIGDYEVSTQKVGFQDTVHKGITLTVGAEVVVDF